MLFVGLMLSSVIKCVLELSSARPMSTGVKCHKSDQALVCHCAACMVTTAVIMLKDVVIIGSFCRQAIRRRKDEDIRLDNS